MNVRYAFIPLIRPVASGALNDSQVNSCTLKRMYLIYVFDSLNTDLSCQFVLWGTTCCIHKHMSQSHESPTCLHLIDQHCSVSDSLGGCTSQITHPWRALRELFQVLCEVRYWLIPTICVGLTYSYVFANHNEAPYPFVPSNWPIGQWCL